jgi:hypothetical protein
MDSCQRTTDYESPLFEAAQLIVLRREAWRHVDIVFITDDYWDVSRDSRGSSCVRSGPSASRFWSDRRRGGGRPRLVEVQRPRVSSSEFDEGVAEPAYESV